MKRFTWLVAFLLICSHVYGTALTANRNTPSRTGKKVQLTVKNDEVIYAGSMVSVDTNGEAVSATDTANDQVVGRACEYVDNADDGETIDVEIGVFGWSADDTINDSHIGDICYVRDDQSVSVTNSGNACIAGIVRDVDDTYVWVDTFNVPRTAGSFTTLSVSGAATLSSTLAMVGVATFTAQDIHNGGIDINEDVDIDLDASDEEISIVQASATGTASTPLINIDDARTGTTANAADEATIYIDAEGSYGLAVVDGIVQVEAEIDTPSGDLLLDPAGSEVHIDGGLHVGGTDAVGDNNLKVNGTSTLDDATVGGKLTVTPVTLTVTNGQAITVADSVYYLTCSGQTSGYTNTATLSDPTVAGDMVTFVVYTNAATSNLFGLADSGNLKLSAALAADKSDTITLLAIDTATWVEVSRSDN